MLDFLVILKIALRSTHLSVQTVFGFRVIADLHVVVYVRGHVLASSLPIGAASFFDKGVSK